MHYTVSHEDLQESLWRLEAALSASEAHGLLCGTFCSEGRAPFADWAAEVLGEAADSHEETARAVRTSLEALHEETLQGLTSGQYAFELFLPDDEAPMGERAEALGEWCEGFLLGFAKRRESSGREMPEEVDEIINDVVEISRIEKDFDEVTEEDEQALSEVVEYLRMSVMLILETLHPALRQQEN